jgi:hypothetical protein
MAQNVLVLLPHRQLEARSGHKHTQTETSDKAACDHDE